MARSALVELASENADALTSKMARKLSFGMDRFAREVELQARRPSFAGPATSVASMRVNLKEIQKVYNGFAYRQGLPHFEDCEPSG